MHTYVVAHSHNTPQRSMTCCNGPAEDADFAPECAVVWCVLVVVGYFVWTICGVLRRNDAVGCQHSCCCCCWAMCLCVYMRLWLVAPFLFSLLCFTHLTLLLLLLLLLLS